MHQRESGRWAITAVYTDDERAQAVQEWINNEYDGKDSVAVKQAIKQAMED